MQRLPLPAPRRLPWKLKPLESALSSLEYDAFGRMVMKIEHDTVRGVTPRMLVHWFSNIDGTIEIEGEHFDRYLAWHPNDHIKWELAREAPGGGAAAGAAFRIVEAFGREKTNHVDVVEEVTRLDASGITLVNRRWGMEVSRLTHDFEPVEGGTRYVSKLVVGVALPGLGRLINAILRRTAFREAKGHAWIRHNIEEVGLLEHLLPLLVAQEEAAERGRRQPAHAALSSAPLSSTR